MTQVVLRCTRCKQVVGLQFSDERPPERGCNDSTNDGDYHDWQENADSMPKIEPKIEAGIFPDLCECACGCTNTLANPESIMSGVCAPCRHGNPDHIRFAQERRMAEDARRRATSNHSNGWENTPGGS